MHFAKHTHSTIRDLFYNQLINQHQDKYKDKVSKW